MAKLLRWDRGGYSEPNVRAERMARRPAVDSPLSSAGLGVTPQVVSNVLVEQVLNFPSWKRRFLYLFSM